MKYLILFLLVTVSIQAQESSWEEVDKKEDITVFVRKSEGSKLKEVKIIGQIQCPLSELVKALEDVDSHGEWVKSTIESRTLDKTAVNDFHYYISTNMPYPVKDRDVVIKYHRTQDPTTKVVNITFDGVNGKLEKQGKLVRIPFFKAYYNITPTKDNIINLEYYFKVDPGGSIPNWIANMAMTKGPMDTIESLFALIRSGHYKGAVVDGVVGL